MHQICYGFYWTIKKWWKLCQKTDFLGHFVSFFMYALFHPMNYTPGFCQMKDLFNIYIYISVISFISIGYAVVKLKIFKVSWLIQHLWNGPFLGIFWLLFPQILFDLAEILNRVSPIRQTHCLKNPSKLWNWAQMESTASLRFWSILGPNLLPENEKYC